MEKDKAAQLVAMYGDKFPNYVIPQLYSTLENMDYSQASICMAQNKDPLIARLLSILVGGFGIDRFYLGDTLLGVLKLITCGGCGIWTIIDWFLVMNTTKEKNYARFIGVSL